MTPRNVPIVPGDGSWLHLADVEAVPEADCCLYLAAILISGAVVVVNAMPLSGGPDDRTLATTNGTGQMAKGSSVPMRPGQAVSLRSTARY